MPCDMNMHETFRVKPNLTCFSLSGRTDLSVIKMAREMELIERKHIFEDFKKLLEYLNSRGLEFIFTYKLRSITRFQQKPSSKL